MTSTVLVPLPWPHLEWACWTAMGLLVASTGWGLRGTPFRCLNYVLEELKHNAKAKVMVASHNEDTVRFTLRR